MKRSITLLLSLAMISAAVLAGCRQAAGSLSAPAEVSPDQLSEETPDAAPAPIDDPWGLTLSASDVTPSGLTLTFTQSGGSPTGELLYGAMYWLEQETEDGWTAVPAIDGEEAHTWTLEAYIVPMNDSRDQQVNWKWLYGQLETGHYRIGKSVTAHRAPGDNDDVSYYAEFDIA